MKTLLNSNDEQTESKFKLWQLIAAFGAGAAIVFAVVFVPKVGLQGYTKLDIEAECNGDKEAAEEAAENSEGGGGSGGEESSDSSSSTEPDGSSEGSGTRTGTGDSGNKNIDNAVDTLVIVNSDDYSIGEEDIEDLFKSGNKLWLEPKVNIKFSIIDTKIVSFSNENVLSYQDYLDKKYFKEFKSNSPEFIVVLDKDGTSNLYGGYSYSYQLKNSNKDYCNEFQPIILNEISIPVGVINYQHKFGRCGYDDFGENIISKVSGNGECQNQDGLTCIFKNGYQMCPNLVDKFYAQNSLNFTIDTIIHELLHAYGENGDFDHFGTDICNKTSGTKIEELEKAGVSAPFDDLFQEYAGICPNVWENLKNSQNFCKKEAAEEAAENSEDSGESGSDMRGGGSTEPDTSSEGSGNGTDTGTEETDSSSSGTDTGMEETDSSSSGTSTGTEESSDSSRDSSSEEEGT